MFSPLASGLRVILMSFALTLPLAWVFSYELALRTCEAIPLGWGAIYSVLGSLWWWHLVLWNAWNRPSISALCADSWQGDTSSLCMDRCQALMRHLGGQVSSKISYLRAKEPMSAWCQHDVNIYLDHDKWHLSLMGLGLNWHVGHNQLGLDH